MSLNASWKTPSKVPTSFLSGPFWKIPVHFLTLGHRLAQPRSLLRLQWQLLNILLVTVSVCEACVWMSSFLLWHPSPLKEPPAMMRCSLFRNKNSASSWSSWTVPFWGQIFESLWRLGKREHSLPEESFAFRSSLSAHNPPAANPREEISKRKCESRGFKGFPVAEW